MRETFWKDEITAVKPLSLEKRKLIGNLLCPKKPKALQVLIDELIDPSRERINCAVIRISPNLHLVEKSNFSTNFDKSLSAWCKRFKVDLAQKELIVTKSGKILFTDNYFIPAKPIIQKRDSK